MMLNARMPLRPMKISGHKSQKMASMSAVEINLHARGGNIGAEVYMLEVEVYVKCDDIGGGGGSR